MKSIILNQIISLPQLKETITPPQTTYRKLLTKFNSSNQLLQISFQNLNPANSVISLCLPPPIFSLKNDFLRPTPSQWTAKELSEAPLQTIAAPANQTLQ